MSKPREKELWKWLSKASDALGALHMQRIETVTGGSGVFDVEFCFAGHSGWLELKTCARPVGYDTKIDSGVSQAQLDWAKARIDAGGSAAFLLLLAEGEGWSVNGSTPRVKVPRPREIFMVAGWDGRHLLDGVNAAGLARLNLLPNSDPTPAQVIAATRRAMNGGYRDR